MGSQISRLNKVAEEKKKLKELQAKEGAEFPGSDFHATDHKEWMCKSHLKTARVKDIMWPGTHDSATDRIGIPFVTQPLAQCQDCSVYHQLVKGARVLDIRVENHRLVCHGILTSYPVDVVIDDIKRFQSETQSEFLILEIRTEYGHDDPPDFDKWLIEQLGEHLIHQDNQVFDRTLGELLPKRVICVWKPTKAAAAPPAGGPLWSSAYLKDNWIDTDLPATKFESNMKYMASQPPVASRRYFYRVENTVTPQADNPIVCVKPVTDRIRGYARLFISQAFRKGYGDRLQILSTDYIDKDFVDACIGVTRARMKPN
eukprot:Gb_33542 [translate_table: standard]